MSRLKGVAPTVPPRTASHPSHDPPHGHPATLSADQLVSVMHVSIQRDYTNNSFQYNDLTVMALIDTSFRKNY